MFQYRKHMTRYIYLDPSLQQGQKLWGARRACDKRIWHNMSWFQTHLHLNGHSKLFCENIHFFHHYPVSWRIMTQLQKWKKVCQNFIDNSIHTVGGEKDCSRRRIYRSIEIEDKQGFNERRMTETSFFETLISVNLLPSKSTRSAPQTRISFDIWGSFIITYA